MDAFVSYVTTWFVIGILEVFDTKSAASEQWERSWKHVFFVRFVGVGAGKFHRSFLAVWRGKEVRENAEIKFLDRCNLSWSWSITMMRSLCLHDIAEDRTWWCDGEKTTVNRTKILCKCHRGISSGSSSCNLCLFWFTICFLTYTIFTRRDAMQSV